MADELISQYHNSSFAEWVEKCKSIMYTYSIEKEDGVVTLSIQSTSLAELDGEEEGVLGEFSYQEKGEAQDDIQTAIDITGIDFDEV